MGELEDTSQKLQSLSDFKKSPDQNSKKLTISGLQSVDSEISEEEAAEKIEFKSEKIIEEEVEEKEVSQFFEQEIEEYEARKNSLEQTNKSLEKRIKELELENHKLGEELVSALEKVKLAELREISVGYEDLQDRLEELGSQYVKDSVSHSYIDMNKFVAESVIKDSEMSEESFPIKTRHKIDKQTPHFFNIEPLNSNIKPEKMYMRKNSKKSVTNSVFSKSKAKKLELGLDNIGLEKISLTRFYTPKLSKPAQSKLYFDSKIFSKLNVEKNLDIMRKQTDQEELSCGIGFPGLLIEEEQQIELSSARDGSEANTRWKRKNSSRDTNQRSLSPNPSGFRPIGVDILKLREEKIRKGQVFDNIDIDGKIYEERGLLESKTFRDMPRNIDVRVRSRRSSTKGENDINRKNSNKKFGEASILAETGSRLRERQKDKLTKVDSKVFRNIEKFNKEQQTEDLVKYEKSICGLI